MSTKDAEEKAEEQSTFDVSDLEVDPDPEEGEVYTQEAVLQELYVDRNMTYEEIAEFFGGAVDAQKIGHHVRKHGFSRGREGPAYDTNAVPVGRTDIETEQGTNIYEIEHPLPAHIVEKMDLSNPNEEGSDMLRYWVTTSSQGDLQVLIDATKRDREERHTSNERRVSKRPDVHHYTAKYPIRVAQGIGLSVDGGKDLRTHPKVPDDYQMGREADITPLSVDFALVRFDPSPPMDVKSAGDLRPPKIDSIPLAKQEVSLTPMSPDGVYTPANVTGYRLRVPTKYARLYGFDRGSPVRYTIGKLDQPGYRDELAIIVNADGGEDKPGVPAKSSRFEKTIKDKVRGMAAKQGMDISEMSNEEILEEFFQEDFDPEQYLPDDTDHDDEDLDILEAMGDVTVGSSQMPHNHLKGRTSQNQSRVQLTPPKALFHTLGYGLKEGKENQRIKATLVPGDGYFAIVPSQDQPKFDAMAYVREGDGYLEADAEDGAAAPGTTAD